MSLKEFSEVFLLFPCLLLIFCGCIISLKLRFIQITSLKNIILLFFKGTRSKSLTRSDPSTINARSALYTAMSTTLGTSTLVAPAIAIKLGGSTALLGMLVATLLGGGISFAEVSLALRCRKKYKDGSIQGGPMPYISLIHPKLASCYAFFTLLLLLVWSSHQSNTLADLFHQIRVPHHTFSPIFTCLVMLALIRGIRLISKISSYIVPIMFILFVTSSSWILWMNRASLPDVIWDILTPTSTGNFLKGSALGGILLSFRWGVFKGFQCNEAGAGTATIPHSMAKTATPTSQGLLSLISIYTQGFISLLSGLVILVTKSLDKSSHPGIETILKSYQEYFPHSGTPIFIISTSLFAYGTILGNLFNSSQCYRHFSSKKRSLNLFYIIATCMIFFGVFLDVEKFWIIVDFFLLPVFLINVLSVTYFTFKKKEWFKTDNMDTIS